MRIRTITLSTLTLAVALAGCTNEAAEQRRAAVKVIDAAQTRLEMIPFDLPAAAAEATQVLADLRAVDAPAGALAGMKGALSARAEMIIAEAALDAARTDRRSAAQLTGRIEARLLAVADLQRFVDHAPFRAENLGVATLQQDVDSRVQLIRALDVQARQFQDTVDALKSVQREAQLQVVDAREHAFQMRDTALEEASADSIGALTHSGQLIAELAPEESRLDELDTEIKNTLTALEQLHLLIDGETATIEAIEVEHEAIDSFIQARTEQVAAVEAHIATLKQDLVADAASLASLEAGSLTSSAADAMGHFEAAAMQAQRAARADRRNGGADLVLAVAARQAALGVVTSRLQLLNRASTVFNVLAAQPNLPDAATWREHARTLNTSRDAALQQAVETADAAMEAAEQLDDDVTSEAIRARIGTLQAAFAGRAVSAAAVAAPPAVPTTPAAPPQQPTDPSDG